MEPHATALINAQLRLLSEITKLPHTWRWLSQKTGIEYNRIHRLKRGDNRYQHSEAIAVAAVLGMKMGELFAEDIIEPDGSSGHKGGRQPRPPGEEAA